MDKGLVEFIHTKISAGNSEEEIISALKSAGIEDSVIESGFIKVRKQYPDIHQDIVAANNFLPPLKKSNFLGNLGTVTRKVISIDLKEDDRDYSNGFFAGRIRRRDFILGLFLIPGSAIIFITVIFSFLKIVSRVGYDEILTKITQLDFGLIAIFALILLPFLIKLLDLITRRFHDIGLSGLPTISLIFAVELFLPILNEVRYVTYIYLLLFALFLCIKKGTQGDNKYGEHYSAKGSFIRRILNFK